jgi:hypothetical protein
MSTILKEILFVIAGIVGGIGFWYLKDKLFNKAKTTVGSVVAQTIPDEDKAKIQDLYDKKLIDQKTYEKYFPPVVAPVEVFDSKKAVTGLTNIKDPVLWMKDIAGIFNLRKIIIYLAIIGIIFAGVYGYGIYKGKLGKPLTIALDYGQEMTINLGQGIWLHITKDGKMHVQDNENDKIAHTIRVIKVRDIAQLRKELKPYGFDIKFFATAGGSLGEKTTGFEGGLGAEFFHWFKTNANVFLTNLGGYLGVGYNITDNFDLMIGVGKGYKGDNRVGLFGKFKF